MRRIVAVVLAFAVAGLMLASVSPMSSAQSPAPSSVAARDARPTTLKVLQHSRKVSQGRSASIQGVIRPARRTKVVLQVRYRGRSWKTIDRGRTSAKGGIFDFTDAIGSTRVREYRVRTRVRKGPRAATSKPVTVRVKAVQDLVDVASTGGGLMPTDGIQIPSYHYELGGTQLISDPTVNSGHITIALKKRCHVLKLAPGSASESAAGSIANVKLELDGKVVYTDTYAPGQGPYAMRLQRFNVRKVKKMRFSYTTTNPNTGPGEPNGVYVGWAYATVGCLPALPRR